MAFIDSIYERAKANKKRVAIPECTNPTMMKAAVKAAADGVAEVVFVGVRSDVEAVAKDNGLDLSLIQIVDVTDEAYRAQLIEQYSQSPYKVMSPKSVSRRIEKPLYMAMVMEAVGDVDCTFAGLDTTTYEFVMAANSIIGLAEGCITPSGLLVLEVEGFEGEQGNIFGMADGAVCVEPNEEQLASIAISCCETFEALVGREAYCGFLSYSTDGSGNSPGVERVRAARDMAQAQRPDLKIDGEFQSDAAILPRVAAKKVKRESAVAGKANVLIFPDAAACNAGTKLIQILADCTTYGPVYQGFRLPVLDCSRSDTEDRLYNNIAMSSVMAAYGKKK